MYTGLNQYHVVMEAAPQFSQDPQALREIYVMSPSGREVPLSTITHYLPTTSPLAVNHQGLVPAVTLSFNLTPGVALGDAVIAIEEAASSVGLPATIHSAFAGTAQAYQDSLTNEPLLIAAALAAVYIVLGILYESFIHPITILSTLPSAGVGALLALSICHMELSVIAIIGMILLIGLVKKNAIMMIDFALAAERNEQKNSRDAIYEACLLRFRPILMTTMAALFGALPLALGSGSRVGASSAAGDHDHRGVDCQPATDALYNACGVPLLGPPASAAWAITRRGRQGSRFRGSGASSNRRRDRLSSAMFSDCELGAQAASAAFHHSDIVAFRSPSLPVLYCPFLGSGANARVANDDQEMQRLVPIEDLFKGPLCFAIIPSACNKWTWNRMKTDDGDKWQSFFVLVSIRSTPDGGHGAIAMENGALRLQLAAFQRKRKRPVLSSFDLWSARSRRSGE